MVSGSELQALKVVKEQGGETSIYMVSKKMGIDTGYARLLCMSLARADYLDLLASGVLRLTPKGKSVLEPPEERRETGRGRFGTKAAEGLQWKSVTEKTGLDWKPFTTEREEWSWKPLKLDRGGRSYSTEKWRGRSGEILREETYHCAFCGGKGERPRGAKCSVCMGSGLAKVTPPAVVCAYCKGRGEERPRSNVTCTVCRGKGVVSISEPIEVCPSCRGTGAAPQSSLPCLSCRGKGVITKPKVERTVTRPKSMGSQYIEPYIKEKEAQLKRGKTGESERLGPRNATASELEVLEVYELVEKTKMPINVSDYTRMSPGYVQMLTKSLVRNALLIPIGPRKYKITEEGKKLLEKRRK